MTQMNTSVKQREPCCQGGWGGSLRIADTNLSYTGRMNKVPQHDTENHIQDPEIDYKAKEHKKGCVCTHTHTEVYI